MDTWPEDIRRIARIAAGVQRLNAVFSRLNDKVLNEHCGFGNSQFKILWVLRNHQIGIPQKMIARWQNQTEASISRQVKLLKKRGLVEERKHPEDKRVNVIVLTDEGAAFTESATRKLIETYAPELAILSEQDQENLASGLETLFYKMCDKSKGEPWKN